MRGKKGPDGEMLFEEEDASTPEQIHHANERSDDSFRQFDTHSHEQVSANRHALPRTVV